MPQKRPRGGRRGKKKPKKKQNPKKGKEEKKQKDKEEKEEDAGALLMQRSKRRWEEDPDAEHQFWATQPVPAMKDVVEQAGPIEEKTLDDVRKSPYLIPERYEWVDMDLKDDKTLDEFYELLSLHYVEDDDNMFRFNYSKEFLRWALLVPGYLQEWHLGVRAVASGRLCASITAIPALVQVCDKKVEMVEINFLCVHKKLRRMRLAPVLIKEITRRVNCRNRWQAVYTAGIVIPKPVARNRYWHRSLNPKKLIEIQFSSMRRRMTMPRLQKLYRVDEETSTPGLRELRESDCESAWKLLSKYLEQFPLHICFNLEEFRHVFLPRQDVVYSYVVEDPETKEITDFISFYNLPSSVINNPKYQEMRAAYSYYNVASHTGWLKLMNDALVLANKHHFDVFNALDVMENEQFLKTLKFGMGDGHLQYYLYNYRLPELMPKDVGVVLL